MKIRGFEKISQEQFKKDFVGTFNEVDYEDLIKPKRATTESACYDLFSPIYFELDVNEEITIPTGFLAYMLNDETLKIYPRSGHGFKFYIRLANTVGIGDADYTGADNEGHYFVKLRNEGNKKFVCEKGQAFAQAMFQKYLLADGDDFENGKTRTGGFGSTDK